MNGNTSRLRVLSALALLSVFLPACSDDSGKGGGGGPGGTDGCAKSFDPSSGDQEAVQTAFIDAKAGDVICFGEGTYTFTGELSLDADGVTLRGEGQEKTIFDFSGQKTGANGIKITSDGVTVQSLQVLDTPGDSIRATDVQDVAFDDVKIAWTAKASTKNGAYGLYPVGSSGVRIEKCTVTGARDAGVYVGQSTKILVANNEVYGNVAGIEIENSTDAEVVGNHSHDNVAGILVFNLPDLPVQDGKRAKIHDNIVENNNQVQFAEDGTVVAKVPVGIGILMLASDENEIHDNTITGNDSAGFAIVSYLGALFGGFDDKNFDPFPEGNYIHGNKFSGNGTKPDAQIKAVQGGKVPTADMLWDGCIDPDKPKPAKNCFEDNGKATYASIGILCDAGGVPFNDDLEKVTCDYPSLPAQDP